MINYMKYQYSLDQLEIWARGEGVLDCSKETHEDYLKHWVTNLQELVDKATPKDPIRTTMPYMGVECIINLCPHCKKQMSIAETTSRHCECGQAIRKTT